MKAWPPIYILRHGQSDWNAEGRVQGSLESRLTGLGRWQASMQRNILSSLDLDGYTGWTSPQRRASETAEIALTGLLTQIIPDARLAEIALGDWEGRLYADLEMPFSVDEADENALHVFDHAPGGEGFAALHIRCLSFLRDLPGPAVLVTHGVTSRMIRLILLDRDICEIGALPGGQGVVYHVSDGVHSRLG